MTGPRDGEFELIRRHFAPLAAGTPAARGLVDDAAVLALATGSELVVTADALVAGVHFPADEAPALIARKALRVNLSDLAAMAAAPIGYTLAGAFPRHLDDAWFGDFAAGLAADQAEFSIALLGGDTVATTGPLTLAVTALGEVPAGGALSRAGARTGDHVFVSGTIGDGALGLALLEGRATASDGAARDWLVDRYRLPTPRLALGMRLRGLASAAIDVSDGLVADLSHICAAADVGARIEAAAVPLSPAARALVTNPQPLPRSLLAGGDDYELLFTVPPEAADEIAALADALALPLTRVGDIVAGTDGGTRVVVVDAAGKPVKVGNGGYKHF